MLATRSASRSAALAALSAALLLPLGAACEGALKDSSAVLAVGIALSAASFSPCNFNMTP